MEVSFDELVKAIVKQTLEQCGKHGIQVTSQAQPAQRLDLARQAERPDMSAYKTKVLTERMVDKLHPMTGKVIIPEGTIISPRARDKVREKGIILENEEKSL